MAETPLSKEPTEEYQDFIVKHLSPALLELNTFWLKEPRTTRKDYWLSKIRRAACMARKLPKLQKQNQALKKQIAGLRFWNGHFQTILPAQERLAKEQEAIIKRQARDLKNWKCKAARIAAHLEIQPGETLVHAAARHRH